MTPPHIPPSSGQPDPSALLALGLATQAPDANAGADVAPPPSPADLAAEFPQLEIIELLGRGGMGAVYKARQRDLDRLVALKILRPGLDAYPGFAERFTREARALAQLNHPGIVTLYEFGRTTAGRYFILMEFVDGVNLRQLLSAGRLAPREALAIVPPLCDALQYAHDRGLVHRDIKPENILMDRLGRVKIADFGIARLASEVRDGPPGKLSANVTLTQTGGVMGTPAYMAPEQRDRPGEVDHRADLYALGIVFYQMLTGELPAAGQLQPPSTRVQLDVRLNEIVLRALAKDPARRYAAAIDFKTQVETVANTPASVAPFVSPSPDQGFSYRSHHTFLGLPLLHVATGVDPVTGKRRIARGVVAIGDHAQGIFAFGGVAVGAVSFGGASFGLFSYGGLALGLLAHGGLGIGALASFAGLALAPIAMGGSAIGWYAYGGAAWGRHVNSPSRHDPAAVDFFGTWARDLTQAGSAVTSLLFVLGFALMFFAIAWARKRAANGSAPAAVPADDSTAPALPVLPASVLVFFLFCLCGSLQFAAKNFPGRVAVHFNLAGHPDGWAERGVALLIFLMIGVGVSFFIPCLFALLRFLPAEFINLPHRDFWLAPQRAASTHARLLRAGLWIGALNAAFFWGLQILSHWAHLSNPPKFPMAALWILAGLFLGAITLCIIRLIRMFNRPELAANPPAPSRISRALRPAAPWLLLFLIFIGIIIPVETALDILRAHQASTSPATSSKTLTSPAATVPQFYFGETRDLTLSRRGQTGGYDLDSGRFIAYAPTPKSPHGIQSSREWRLEQGVDCFYDLDSFKPGFDFEGVEVRETDFRAWDEPAGTAVEYLERDPFADSTGIYTFIPAPEYPKTVKTLVYRTPQQGLVLVQVFRATDDRDIRVRYKPILPISSADNHTPVVSIEDQRAIRFDRADDTMQNIVQRLRHDYGVRLCFENLDFTIADAKTAAQIIAEADRNGNAPYSKLQKRLLELARESHDPNTLIDLGARYTGLIEGATVPEFFDRLTANTPYMARKIATTWVIQPRAGSVLTFPVTLKTAGLSVDEALQAILEQAPGDKPINTVMVFTMPMTHGTDPTPWLSTRAPALEFNRTPAAEALCRLTATASPASVWELAGYRDSRMFSTAPAPTRPATPAIKVGTSTDSQ